MLFLFDARKRPSEETERVVERLASMKKTLMLALNKTDTVENKPTLLDRAQWFRDRATWKDIFFIAAREGEGLDGLKAALVAASPQGQWFYPEDTLTDLPMRLLASELTREQCFMSLQKKFPTRSPSRPRATRRAPTARSRSARSSSCRTSGRRPSSSAPRARC
ncbi:MAG: hypothetical protein WDN72_04900 [Alphaproteobacteria bacterium]